MAANNTAIERLAMCQDSWVEWKQGNPAQLEKFAADFRTQFVRNGNEAFLVPRSSQSVIGLPLAQIFPESVGMGVGFSVLVNASFERTKSALERKLGKAFKKCERGDGMNACELPLAEKKTVMLIAEDKPNTTTALFGCYYFYEK